MKKYYPVLPGILVAGLSYGQTDSKSFPRLMAEGDSLYKIKEYRLSALSYTAALQVRSGSAPWARWKACRSWVAADFPDSAFYYLDPIVNRNDLTIPEQDDILTDPAFNKLHSDPRWPGFSSKMISNYRSIAINSSEKIRSGFWTNSINDGYDAAQAWAAAGEKDSAFKYLDKIVNTDYNVFINYPVISEDSYLKSLYTDKRWQPILDAVKNNWSWIETRHSFTGPLIPMVATFDAESKFLKDDGRGCYKNGIDKVRSVDQHAYNLQVSAHAAWYESGNRRDLSPRFIILDLNSPVKGSGSLPLGIVKDNDLEFHVSYKLDTTVHPQIVYNFREIPVGARVESDRTEIEFYINDVLHTLTMGPWGFGRNNEAIAHKGKINGAGTTPVIVTRHSETSYTIEAPQGSIGRLWRTQNMTKPVDMGLYTTGFKIHLEKQ